MLIEIAAETLRQPFHSLGNSKQARWRQLALLWHLSSAARHSRRQLAQNLHGAEQVTTHTQQGDIPPQPETRCPCVARNPSYCFQIMAVGGGSGTRCGLKCMVDISLRWLTTWTFHSV